LKLSIDFDYSNITILRFLLKQHDGRQSKRGAVEALHEKAEKS
jgi:hypothetical protein